MKYKELVSKNRYGFPEITWTSRRTPRRVDTVYGYRLVISPGIYGEISLSLYNHEDDELLLRGRLKPRVGSVQVRDDDLRAAGMSTYMIFIEMAKRAAELGLLPAP